MPAWPYEYCGSMAVYSRKILNDMYICVEAAWPYIVMKAIEKNKNISKKNIHILSLEILKEKPGFAIWTIHKMLNRKPNLRGAF